MRDGFQQTQPLDTAQPRQRLRCRQMQVTPTPPPMSQLCVGRHRLRVRVKRLKQTGILTMVLFITKSSDPSKPHSDDFDETPEQVGRLNKNSLTAKEVLQKRRQQLKRRLTM